MMVSIVLLDTLQPSQDLQHQYGLPDAERYVVQSGIIMTILFAEEGRLRKNEENTRLRIRIILIE